MEEVKKLGTARKWLENALRLTQMKDITPCLAPVAQASLASSCLPDPPQPVRPHALRVTLRADTAPS